MPSVPASGMAVNGRQNLYRNLASQTAMPASAIAMFNKANSRAFSDKVVRCSSAVETAIRFQWEMVLSVQKKAMTV